MKTSNRTELTDACSRTHSVHQARIHLTDLLTSRHIPGLLASQEVVMKEKLATPGPKVRHKGWEKNETIGWAKFLDVEGYPNE